MKQQYLIFWIMLLAISTFCIWTFMSKKEPQKLILNSISTNDKNKPMEIRKSDIEQAKEIDDILPDLIKKYYPDYNDKNFNQLDIVTQTFVLIVNADGQIQNGGIIQFIDNGTGNRFHETIDAAKRINNHILVEILTNVTTQYPKGKIPSDWNYRRELWDKLCDQHENDENWDNFWDNLDETYYKNSKAIYQSLINYLKTNAKLTD